MNTLINFRFQISGFRFQVSGFRFQVSDFRYAGHSASISNSGLARKGVAFGSSRGLNDWWPARSSGEPKPGNILKKPIVFHITPDAFFAVRLICSKLIKRSY